MQHAATAGGRSLLGLRPEHLRLVDQAAPGRFPRRRRRDHAAQRKDGAVDANARRPGDLRLRSPAWRTRRGGRGRRSRASIRTARWLSTRRAAPVSRRGHERAHAHRRDWQPSRHDDVALSLAGRRQDLRADSQGARARRQGARSRRAQGRDRRAARLVRLRQDIHLAHDRGLRICHQGLDHARRPPHRRVAAGAARRGDGLRGLFALPAADRSRQHRLRAEEREDERAQRRRKP